MILDTGIIVATFRGTVEQLFVDKHKKLNIRIIKIEDWHELEWTKSASASLLILPLFKN